ncbi:hypothetical protein [Haloferula sp.]|uniref:hypothetical protein n=1 Tax=Haloferula sp. TaxID=2497595 RepID=UPI003C74030D
MKVPFALWLFPTLGTLLAATPDWENEAVFRINKEEARATLLPDAKTPASLDSPWCQVLDGTWKFHHVGNPDARPIDFFKPGFDVSGWDDI